MKRQPDPTRVALDRALADPVLRTVAIITNLLLDLPVGDRPRALRIAARTARIAEATDKVLAEAEGINGSELRLHDGSSDTGE